MRCVRNCCGSPLSKLTSFAAKGCIARNGAGCVLVQGIGGVGRDEGVALLVVVRRGGAVADGVVGVVVVEAADGRVGKSAAGGDHLGAKVVAVGIGRARKVAEGRAGSRNLNSPPKGVVEVREG